MKIAIILVCLTLFVASEAFNDNFRRMAMFNTLSGRSPFDFSGMFGPHGNAGGMGMGNLGMLFLVDSGDGFFGM